MDGHRRRDGMLTGPLEELNGSLVFLGRRSGLERPEIPAPACFGVLLSRIQTVLSVLELSYHRVSRPLQWTGKRAHVRCRGSATSLKSTSLARHAGHDVGKRQNRLFASDQKQ